MSWESLTLATDSDIGALEPEAVNPDAPWGRSSWPQQLALAKRDLRVWVDTDFADVVGASDRIMDRFAVPHVFGFTGGAWTDYTVEASDREEEDIPLATIFATPGTDAIYVGSYFAYSGLFVHLLDSDSVATSDLTVSYWGANEWTSVPSQNDGTVATSGQTMGQSGRVTWAKPDDWNRRSLNNTAEEFYWTRLQVSATLTAGTAATHLLAIRVPDVLKSIHERLTLAKILSGLERQAANPEEWRTKATMYLEDATALWERAKTKGAIPIDLDISGAIDESERTTDVRVEFLRA